MPYVVSNNNFINICANIAVAASYFPQCDAKYFRRNFVYNTAAGENYPIVAFDIITPPFPTEKEIFPYFTEFGLERINFDVYEHAREDYKIYQTHL